MSNQVTRHMTMAQAVIAFLKNQYVERDGRDQPFFAGCFGIFGHGNIGGIGQALQQMPEFRYYQSRNEQAMVHTAVAYAKTKNRLQTFVCTSSIGPGATNMVTGAALATINRLPVLLLPGDIFARRNVAPVLQQLESEHTQDISVNDCFKPVSRYWDRITRPEQLLTSLPEAMRVLTSPAETGAVTLALPQDVQAEAYAYPEAFFHKRVWHIMRNRPDRKALEQAAAWIRASQRPLIVAGGGVIYSGATDLLQRFVDQTGVPVGETMAGKGSLRYDHPLNLGAIGATGTFAANRIAREADLVIGIGTRYSDFTTSSKTAFQHPGVRFINLNVAEFDASKHLAMPLVGDAQATLEELLLLLAPLDNSGAYSVEASYRSQAAQLHTEWDAEVERIYTIRHTPLPSQGELIGAVNERSTPGAIMVCAAGSLPGDLHKLWRARHPKNYHMEYGYSCMGYEIAGGLGAKMAAPERDVYVMVGDGSYLMMATELVTAVQEHIKIIVVLVQNYGFASIGGLSESVGAQRFGTAYRYRNPHTGRLDGDKLPVDLAANAASLGVDVIRAATIADLRAALASAKEADGPVLICIETDPLVPAPDSNSWWDVPIAEVSELESVTRAHQAYQAARSNQRRYL